jgi:hypothetical protein
MPLKRRPLLRRKRFPDVDWMRPIGFTTYSFPRIDVYIEGFSTPT